MARHLNAQNMSTHAQMQPHRGTRKQTRNIVSVEVPLTIAAADQNIEIYLR